MKCIDSKEDVYAIIESISRDDIINIKYTNNNCNKKKKVKKVNFQKDKLHRNAKKTIYLYCRR